MAKSVFDTQIDILLEAGKSLNCGLTRRLLQSFFHGKENTILKNGIVLSSYGKGTHADAESQALVELAERQLGSNERFVFDNKIGGKTCVIIGKAASELAKLAVCDMESRETFKSNEVSGLSNFPCKIPKGRNLKHFGNKRIKDMIFKN